jgi:hypothetical protein
VVLPVEMAASSAVRAMHNAGVPKSSNMISAARRLDAFVDVSPSERSAGHSDETTPSLLYECWSRREIQESYSSKRAEYTFLILMSG